MFVGLAEEALGRRGGGGEGGAEVGEGGFLVREGGGAVRQCYWLDGVRRMEGGGGGAAFRIGGLEGKGHTVIVSSRRRSRSGSVRPSWGRRVQ